MEKSDLKELHYITPIENVHFILKHGILSHNLADKLAHKSVAMAEIQDRRKDKVVPGGKKLHDYANLYFTARNPMLYLRLAQIDTLCVLSLKTDILDLNGVIVTDKNAAGDYVRFAPSPDGLSKVNKELTFAESWTDGDYITYLKKKAAKCAEILVPERVTPEYIRGAYVGNEAAQAAFKALKVPLPCRINKHLFFL